MASVALHNEIGFAYETPENVKHDLLDGSEHIQTMAKRSKIACFGTWINKDDIETWLGEYMSTSTGQLSGSYTTYYLDGEATVSHDYPIKDYVNVNFTASVRTAVV